ncbi:hypothetical protein LCGC14_1457770 [marine sediment metagenome]|uniref:Uncharacterized protein n=1 Tax=marine sediment metagenome TaxID=412755 RepID=A0A0F9JFY8_9ZZZZ
MSHKKQHGHMWGCWVVWIEGWAGGSKKTGGCICGLKEALGGRQEEQGKRRKR